MRLKHDYIKHKKNGLQLLCIACVVALRVTDDESRRVFSYLRSRSREWSLLNNVTWGSIGTYLWFIFICRDSARLVSGNWTLLTYSFPDFREFRRCSGNSNLRRIRHYNNWSPDRRGYRGTPRSKDGNNCFLFLIRPGIHVVDAFRNDCRQCTSTIWNPW